MTRYYSYERGVLGDPVQTGCFVCGSSKHDEIGRDHGYRVVRCPDCDFVFVNPRPTSAQLRQLYESYYSDHEVAAPAWEREMSDVVDECCEMLLAFRPQGTVLDVGSSYGHLLRSVEAIGWQGVGVEPSTEAAAYSRQLGDSEVLVGALDEVELEDERFDAVVTLYVLEHVADPRAFVATFYRVLQPGGLAIIRIPHTTPLMPMKRLLRRSLMEAPMHLNDFSPESLRALALDLGFSKVEARVGRSRRASDPLERYGAMLFGGTGLLLEKLSGGRILFRWSGAKTYLLWK